MTQTHCRPCVSGVKLKESLVGKWNKKQMKIGRRTLSIRYKNRTNSFDVYIFIQKEVILLSICTFLFILLCSQSQQLVFSKFFLLKLVDLSVGSVYLHTKSFTHTLSFFLGMFLTALLLVDVFQYCVS